MFEITAYADQAAQTTDAAAGTVSAGGGMIGTIIYLAAIFAAFYFFLIRPQRKQSRAHQSMLDSLRVNDEVVTTGGIMGKVVSIKEDSVTVETGADRTKLRFERGAIKSVLTVHDDE